MVLHYPSSHNTFMQKSRQRHPPSSGFCYPSRVIDRLAKRDRTQTCRKPYDLKGKRVQTDLKKELRAAFPFGSPQHASIAPAQQKAKIRIAEISNGLLSICLYYVRFGLIYARL